MIRSAKLSAIVFLLVSPFAITAVNAADDPKPKANPPAARPAATGNPWVGVGGGGGLYNPGAANWGRYAVWQTVSLISELNMTPTFTLTAEQKEKILAIRDAARKEQDEWREAKAADFKALQEQMMAVRPNDPGAQEKWAEFGKAQQELMATAPKEDEAVAQIKAVLTNDQLKLMEAESARRQAEAQRMQREAMERYKQYQPQPAPAR